MTEPMNHDALLRLLGRSLPDGQPPADAIQAAYAAHGWRNLDVELARLLDDSEVEVALFDDATHARVLSYDAPAGTIEVRIDADAFEVEASPRPRSVTLHRPEVAVTLDVGDDGRVVGSGVSGSVRFEITWADGSALTPWLTL